MTKRIWFWNSIRKSPYFDATVKWGAKIFQYTIMYIPRDFGSPERKLLELN